MKILPVLFLILVFTSCYSPRYVYSPAAHNVPVLTAKKDSKLGINYSTNIAQRARNSEDNHASTGAGIDVQGAYAFSKHMAVQAAYYWRKEMNEGNFTFTAVDNSILRYRRNLTEAGLGYYTKMNDSGTSWFQLFGGMGVGDFRFTDKPIPGSANTNEFFYKTKLTKFYIQPVVMVLYDKSISLSFSSRFSFLKFHHVRTDYSSTELNNYKLDSITHRPVIFWEPAFVNSFEFKKLKGVKFEYQLGLSLLMSKSFVDARAFNFSAGAFVDIPKMLRK
ncbi:hypothetical protein [Ferruginibacter sp. HRS2-29]|uniref:hypothetical protein n=1 Tax=Ferruginibacter sp. HRS2-29 TaxID=2487334 RepID=UPI0020CD49A8|nr:hypothetical protein [Ferruginibacter sp. HRS2-29]MCP9752662.1 hypothetical protein [Ferruginibacter sp. HRS2-29]